MLMLRKILTANIKKKQMLGAFAGMIFGLGLLLISIGFYRDALNILGNKGDSVRHDYLIINKPVSTLGSSLWKNSGGFNDNDMAEIRSQDFIVDAAPLIASEYRVTAYSDDEIFLPNFYTELFFEAVPDKYLDVDIENWKWSESDSIVPIILPSDYLTLYNFGFAQSQGLPQVSSDMINQVIFKLRIIGSDKQDYFRGRIAGFSNRINSILVPYSFLKWSNNIFGADKKKNPSRVILQIDDASNPELYDFLQAQKYETTSTKARTNTFLRFIFWAETLTAIIIIVLSVLVFIVSFQLVLTRNRDRIRLLIHIGYKWQKIRGFYNWFILIQIIVVNIIAIPLYYIIEGYLHEWLNEKGFSTDFSYQIPVFAYALIISLLIFLLNYFLLTWQIRKMIL